MSAQTSSCTLDDDRLELRIDHAPLSGVTPRMLHWWFQTASQDMHWRGRTIPRYHLWHPIDHIQLRVVRRASDGTVGAGAKFHIVEAFGGNLAYLVDQVVDVTRLDDGGITLAVKALGRTIMELAHTFEARGDATVYRTRMLIGAGGGLAKPIGRWVRRRRFPSAKAGAWLKHNVEEVGNLPHFLPELYARCEGRLDG
jgi:DAPG hydrolase PhiG domain